MPNASTNALEVVGENSVGIEKCGRSVEEDNRRAHASLIQQVAVIVRRWHDQQPVHSPAGQGRDQLALPNLILFGASAKYQDSSLECEFLDRVVEHRIEGVGDVFEDDPDGRTSAICPPEAAR